MLKFSNEQLLELHQEGLTDRQIADTLGVTQAAVNYRRQKMGLKNNYMKKSFSDDELRNLYNQGSVDREIGEALGATQAAVNYRRQRLALKTNYIREKAFLDLFKKGLSAEEIAQKLDAPLPAVQRMMEKYELVLEKAVAEAEI